MVTRIACRTTLCTGLLLTSLHWVNNEDRGQRGSHQQLPDPPMHPGDPEGTGSWHSLGVADFEGDGDIDTVSKIWNKDGPTYHADYWRNDTPVDRFFRSDRGVPTGIRDLPDRLDPEANLRWRVPLAPGHSTPIIHGDRIFLTTHQVSDRTLAVVALARMNGEELWRHVVRPDLLESVHGQMGSPATATPACDGERLYVFFGSYGLLCFDLEGQPLWERRMGPFQDEYGAGSSPILIHDKVILNQDHDRDSFLLAVSRTDGLTLWNIPRPDAVRSYATPVIWSHGNRQELLVAGALELTSYDPNTGDALWRAGGLARIVIPLPVVDGETIYMASWSPGGDANSRLGLPAWTEALGRWDRDQDGVLGRSEITDAEVLDRFYRMDLDLDGRLDEEEWTRHREVFRRAQNAVLALKPSATRDGTEPALAWKYPRGVPYVATPLLHGGCLWMVKDGGIVTVLNAATGDRQQEERLPGSGSYAASPVTGDGKVYFASVAGVVSVVAARRDWQVLSSHDFRERIFATPVLDGDSIIVRTEEALYDFGEPDSAGPP